MSCLSPYRANPYVCFSLPALSSLIANVQFWDLSRSTILSTFLLSRSTLRNAALESQFPTIPAKLRPHIFRQFSHRTLDFLIFWSVPTLQRRGHHHIADLRLGAATNSVSDILKVAEGIAGGLYAESQREREILLSNIQASEYGQSDSPIVISQTCPARLSLDFTKRK